MHYWNNHDENQKYSKKYADDITKIYNNVHQSVSVCIYILNS